jgi:hypothetical protein
VNKLHGVDAFREGIPRQTKIENLHAFKPHGEAAVQYAAPMTPP